MVTANELKEHGVQILSKQLARGPEAMISVRGKVKFVVISPEYYEKLRLFELEAALKEAEADLKAGNVKRGVKAHVKRVARGL